MLCCWCQLLLGCLLHHRMPHPALPHAAALQKLAMDTLMSNAAPTTLAKALNTMRTRPASVWPVPQASLLWTCSCTPAWIAIPSSHVDKCAPDPWCAAVWPDGL